MSGTASFTQGTKIKTYIHYSGCYTNQFKSLSRPSVFLCKTSSNRGTAGFTGLACKQPMGGHKIELLLLEADFIALNICEDIWTKDRSTKFAINPSTAFLPSCSMAWSGLQVIAYKQLVMIYRMLCHNFDGLNSAGECLWLLFIVTQVSSFQIVETVIILGNLFPRLFITEVLMRYSYKRAKIDVKGTWWVLMQTILLDPAHKGFKKLNDFLRCAVTTKNLMVQCQMSARSQCSSQGEWLVHHRFHQ